ncbi:conserved hypothetical protein [uncultured delta proteobacterium]|uniref:tRNA carboxymethyluridine synthase n=1 Tax=uncultured delta proteobacterium TaxID=34034 RepID=A0A212ITW1_9DELT|nr:conserved hypothetical protein [uncultured delta proteobacterium]
MFSRGFSHITAQALVPEQIISYVTAVGGSRPVLCGGCVAYDYEGQRTLIAYEPGATPECCLGGATDQAAKAMDEAVAASLADPSCISLTVLGPARPQKAPADAASRADAYAFLPLPPAPPGQNLRNMLRRGERECAVTEESWTDEHGALVQSYLASRPLEAGTRQIYAHIPRYLDATPGATLFAARDTRAARLLGFAVGDFSSLTTAFYMFAFRSSDCPPGVADVLLRAIVRRAEENGHQYINLGLGINEGIAAFKRKWGNALYLPCIQTSWNREMRAAGGNTRQTAAPNAATDETGASSAAKDPLAVFTPPGLKETFRRFLTGEKRPFACLQVEVTSQCPGRCAYCPHTTKQAVWRSRRMEDETYAALAPLIRAADRVHLQGWGEPLLHPRFFDYAAAAIRVGSAVSTTTYGLAVTDDVAARLVASGMDIVAFSLTGVDEASNRARDGVPFAKVREGILNLNAAKQRAKSALPRVHLAYLMLASQYEDAGRLPELMEALDIPVAVVSTLDYIAAPGMEKDAYAPGETEKIEAARRLLHDAAQKAASMGRALHYSLPGETGRNDCNEHIQTCMYIDADGAVSPCIYVNLPTAENDPCRRVFGSVREKKPLDIWADSDYAVFRQRLAAGDPDLPCQTCAKRFERIY